MGHAGVTKKIEAFRTVETPHSHFRPLSQKSEKRESPYVAAEPVAASPIPCNRHATHALSSNQKTVTIVFADRTAVWNSSRELPCWQDDPLAEGRKLFRIAALGGVQVFVRHPDVADKRCVATWNSWSVLVHTTRVTD